MPKFIRSFCLAAAFVAPCAMVQLAHGAPITYERESAALIGSAYSRAQIEDTVRKAAQADGRVPVSLALAVARVESNFNADAESSKGARGVMQIMPATARDEYGIDPDLLWDPAINAELGVRFLGDLYDMYGSSWDAALSHYNGGSLKNGAPHSYTRRYVADVTSWQAYYYPDSSDAPSALLAQADPVDLSGGPIPLQVNAIDPVDAKCICASTPAVAYSGKVPFHPSKIVPIAAEDREPGWRARAAAERVADARLRIRTALAARGAYD